MVPSKTATKKTSKKSTSKIPTSNKSIRMDFQEKIKECLVDTETVKEQVVLKEQYEVAFELLADADAARLTPIVVGPPGVGKTLLARYYAVTTKRYFEWMTFDESTKPVHFVGSYDPALSIQQGFSLESFIPGPLTKALVMEGIFLANELNRASEFTQNSLLEPLEERSLYISRIGRIRAGEDFFFICAGNPRELAGTHRMSEALKDRITVWINLDYPTKKTELEILKANVPEAKLSDDIFEVIYKIISTTRKHPAIETPASIRSGIAFAKLANQKRSKVEKDFSKTMLDIATTVLGGNIKVRPGMNATRVIEELVRGAVGTI